MALARRRVRASLAAEEVSPQLLDDADLVVSELMGNAVRYARPIAGGMLVLGWGVHDGQVEVRVTDGGSARHVETRPTSVTSVSGRGLHIVGRLAASWGVTEHVGGLRTVWAALSLDGPPVLRPVP